ncbi:MAG: adenylate kinase [Lachnospiraceae bacterium]|nr:adenylate kinase [Lachnospiraceae bacterium]
MKIIMLGAPGAGKGTQADLLAKEFRIPHISTGDIFRKNIKEGTELGRRAKEYMDGGQLVPDEVTIAMLLDRIAEADCADGYILDGFPRTIPQAESLKEALDKKGEAIDVCIDIEVPDEDIAERMSGRRSCPKCGATYHIQFNRPKEEGICDSCGAELIQRADDKAETVMKRLETYHELTQPLIDYYSAQNILAAFDGTRKPDEVFRAILEGLK